MADPIRKKKPVVLIVDDIVKNLQEVGSYLIQAGYEISVAQDGLAALKILETLTPDLILLDVVMPNMDGFEVCTQLKRYERLKEIPVIFFTSMNDTDHITRGFELGGIDYIVKPAKKSELLARVKTHLDLKFSKDRIVKQSQMISEQNNKLQSLLYEKNEFLGITAHDLKSPLTGILSNVELLKQYKHKMNDEQRSERYNNIHDTAIRMHKIISDLLEINALESNELKLNLTNFNIERIIQKLLRSYEQVVKRKRIAIVYESEATNKVVHADETKVEQILENLLSNAVKFSPFYTKVVIKLHKQSHVETQRNFIIVEIKDEGPGISKDEEDKLFLKFSKLSSKPTADESSTGLGLSIVKRLVEAMNGEVWLEDQEKGAAFRFTLPLKPKE